MAEHSRLYVTTVVGFHITTALAVTITSKAVLNILPLPIMLLLCQSAMSLGFISLASIAGLYTIPKLSYSFIRDVSPIIAMKIVAQLSKTFCLVNVNASFYQIVRGLLLPFTILLSCIFLQNSRPKGLAVIACGITSLGFVLGVWGEALGQTSSIGIAWGVWSSLTTALETVLVKYLAFKAGVMDLVLVTSLATTPIYAILAVSNGEFSHAVGLGLFHPVMLRVERVVLLAGTINFALSAAAYLQIRVTSPTTHMISTAARGVLQSLLAVTFLGAERLTKSRVRSIGVILAGSMLYTFAKSIETRGNAIQGVLPFHGSEIPKDEIAKAIEANRIYSDLEGTNEKQMR